MNDWIVYDPKILEALAEKLKIDIGELLYEIALNNQDYIRQYYELEAA